jgi:hypothetical protein
MNNIHIGKTSGAIVDPLVPYHYKEKPKSAIYNTRDVSFVDNFRNLPDPTGISDRQLHPLNAEKEKLKEYFSQKRYEFLPEDPNLHFHLKRKTIDKLMKEFLQNQENIRLKLQREKQNAEYEEFLEKQNEDTIDPTAQQSPPPTQRSRRVRGSTVRGNIGFDNANANSVVASPIPNHVSASQINSALASVINTMFSVRQPPTQQATGVRVRDVMEGGGDADETFGTDDGAPVSASAVLEPVVRNLFNRFNSPSAVQSPSSNRFSALMEEEDDDDLLAMPASTSKERRRIARAEAIADAGRKEVMDKLRKKDELVERLKKQQAEIMKPKYIKLPKGNPLEETLIEHELPAMGGAGAPLEAIPEGKAVKAKRFPKGSLEAKQQMAKVRAMKVVAKAKGKK